MVAVLVNQLNNTLFLSPSDVDSLHITNCCSLSVTQMIPLFNAGYTHSAATVMSRPLSRVNMDSSVRRGGGSESITYMLR